MAGLEFKLALYHYFVEWCCEEPIKHMENCAQKLATEFELLKRRQYLNLKVHLNDAAALPHRWNTSKLVANHYVQTNQIHVDCDPKLKCHLTQDLQYLENIIDEFFKICCKNVFNSYHEQYRLAKLYITGDSKYGSCYYLYVIGHYAITCKSTSKNNSVTFKKLTGQYLSMDIDLMTYFYKTQAIDRDNFLRLENIAWTTFVEYINERNNNSYEPKFLRLHEFFRFVLKNINHAECYDLNSARSHQQRNKIMCLVFLGFQKELRNEVNYYLKKI
ncbi:hypothetical protein [Mocis latipes granulovirus]|uniref:Uncharacterized protein n=1 Tax=Mocis latipes granulovirus TaxID=2072024 RepID=A0A162GVI9_9BBAC|nr:hypothetical protein [Mocis latipes granulovirus]AKR17424.1 hypothetical protein [Mocis latipes granulovirus]